MAGPPAGGQGRPGASDARTGFNRPQGGPPGSSSGATAGRPGAGPAAGNVPPTAAGSGVGANAGRPGGRPGDHAGPGNAATTNPIAGVRPQPGSATRAMPPVAVDRNTTVTANPGGRSGYNIAHKNPDGSQIFISKQPMPDGSTRVSGVRRVDDPQRGTSTRTWSDGRQVVSGRDFDRRVTPSGLGFVSNRNGLREGSLPDGRPSFQDRFVNARGSDGREQRIIERTRYAQWAGGQAQYASAPVVRRYDVGRIHGAPVAQYRPARFSPEWYRGYRTRWVAPVVIAGAAAAAMVAFSQPATQYDDPVALMGDMQISSGFAEGNAYATPTAGAGAYVNPDADAVRDQMAAVQQQVGSSVKADAKLSQQLGGINLQSASAQVQQAVGGAVPIQIAEDTRQQIRQQVRLAVAMHQLGQPLLLDDVLTAGYAKIYLFQTAQPVNVSDLSAGGECFLNTGDLIAFARTPAGDAQVAEMNVVASAASSCRADERVEVRLTDLQEMLNGFMERVEDNLKHVNACASTGRC